MAMLASVPLGSCRGTFSGVVTCKPCDGLVAFTGSANRGPDLFNDLSENMQWSEESQDVCQGLSDSHCFRAASLGDG